MNLFVTKTWLEARFRRGEEGANLVEYILLIALIALLVIVAVGILKDKIVDKFKDACDGLDKGSPDCA